MRNFFCTFPFTHRAPVLKKKLKLQTSKNHWPVEIVVKSFTGSSNVFYVQRQRWEGCDLHSSLGISPSKSRARKYIAKNWWLDQSPRMTARDWKSLSRCTIPDIFGVRTFSNPLNGQLEKRDKVQTSLRKKVSKDGGGLLRGLEDLFGALALALPRVSHNPLRGFAIRQNTQPGLRARSLNRAPAMFLMRSLDSLRDRINGCQPTGARCLRQDRVWGASWNYEIAGKIIVFEVLKVLGYRTVLLWATQQIIWNRGEPRRAERGVILINAWATLFRIAQALFLHRY